MPKPNKPLTDAFAILKGAHFEYLSMPYPQALAHLQKAVAHYQAALKLAAV